MADIAATKVVVVDDVTFDVNGFSVAGLRARPANPIGRVLALHGGGYDARYWHHPASPRTSLLVCGAALGFDVIALDRPGMAGSAGSAPEGLPFSRQIDIVFDLAAILQRDQPLPVFVIGHSLGGMMTLLLAAENRGKLIAAVDVAGVPLAFSPEQDSGMRMALAAAKAAGESHLAASPPDIREAMFYGPPDAFDPKVVAWGPTEHTVPVAEIDDMMVWLATFPDTLSRIRVPVQWTFAGYEASSVVRLESDSQRVTSLLEQSPTIRTALQEGSGHNISLHYVGRAYHLRALAFFEEVLTKNRRNTSD
jgi:pimeloyl-ACP methyl ester carboxylesterase